MTLVRLISERTAAVSAKLRSWVSYANVMATLAVLLAFGGGALVADAAEPPGDPPQPQSQGTDDGEAPAGDGEPADDDGDAGGDGEGEDQDGGDDDGGGGDQGGGGEADDQDDDGDSDAPGRGDDRTSGLNITAREGKAVTTDSRLDQALASVTCAEGEQLVGGGVRTSENGDGAETRVTSSGPDGNGWSAKVVNGSGSGSVTVTAHAFCAAAP